MRDVLFICKISTEIYFGKWKKKISKKFPRFFFQFFLGAEFFINQMYFGNIFSIFIFNILRGAGGERSERRGGVGERSEPPAGGLAQAPEGGVSASFVLK